MIRNALGALVAALSLLAACGGSSNTGATEHGSAGHPAQAGNSSGRAGDSSQATGGSPSNHGGDSATGGAGTGTGGNSPGGNASRGGASAQGGISEAGSPSAGGSLGSGGDQGEGGMSSEGRAGASVGGGATDAVAGKGGTPFGGAGNPAASGAGGVNCDCMLGAYFPVCGVDGVTYDAACGRVCVPVEIECDGMCPCPTGGGTAGAPGDCATDCAAQGLTCCDGACVNTDNDPTNCGRCGTQCSGAASHCNLGSCGEPPCSAGTSCGGGEICCGAGCCTGGQICCLMMVGPWVTQCVDPVEGTCPVGCPLCVCAAPDTPIATPRGERRIADLRVGDPVYTVDDNGIVVAPILETRQTPVQGHRVVRVELANGRVLEISGPHPTLDGRSFGDLAAGQALDGVPIVAVAQIPYEHPFTYDILPASDTGAYFAGGVAIGSTLMSAP